MKSNYAVLLIILVLAVVCLPHINQAATIDSLIDNGGYIVMKDNAVLAQKNADHTFIPASITKIVTSLAALSILGPKYRFQTFFYYGADKKLFIKGGGDPFLISEEIKLIAAKLKNRGIDEISAIVLDDSQFMLMDSADGSGNSLNPYDVDNSALAANFNTVNIEVSTSGKVTSAEVQTPDLAVMKKLGKGLPPGVHRINISNNRQDAMEYVGELFTYFLRENQLIVNGAITGGRAPSSAQPFYIHESSRPLSRMIEAMMLYSNNFIANQIFLTCGAHARGYPATWEKSAKTINDFLATDIGLSKDTITLVEGSGLSRKNYLTPSAMITILEKFKPYCHLLPLEDDVRIKSGTLGGVYSFAGYFPGANGLDSFTLILNQKRNTRAKVIALLRKKHKRP